MNLQLKTIRPLVLALTSCIAASLAAPASNGNDALYDGFVNPPAESRPFVRWWWNGNQLEKAELVRQLDILEKAGFGGVEINPIEMPETAEPIEGKALQWLSSEWNQHLAFAADEAAKRGMLVDLIVGSGWPFGGRFLEADERLQRVLSHHFKVEGGSRIQLSVEELIGRCIANQTRLVSSEEIESSLLFAYLLPSGASKIDELLPVDLTQSKDDVLTVDVPKGEYTLHYGVRQIGARDVMHGAPGSDGPVMDHFDRKVVRRYLERLEKIELDTGKKLNELFRAFFCDSIELAGANWTNGMGEAVSSRLGYSIKPYLPFLFYDARKGYQEDAFLSPALADEIRRVRYDFNRALVHIFLEEFAEEFAVYCTENGIQSRYQAYGIPFLMGLLEGSLIPDIPEGNNWIYSGGVDMDAPEWSWNQGHGYLIWNLYAASAGHLANRKIVSCEAMTNTRGVFSASLEEIKRHDDMNFITGINHSIVHGYNYSPESAVFPGWIRYGAYFSERNPWWKHLSRWTEYNARLSHVFQNSQPRKRIGILAPIGDTWSDRGLVREPFHTDPWYAHRIWEPISQVGSSSDYLAESILQAARIEKGRLAYGPASYETIVLCSAQSLEPESVSALQQFVESGGKLILIHSVPSNTLGRTQPDGISAPVSKTFEHLLSSYPENCYTTESPENEAALLQWTESLFDRCGIERDVQIKSPSSDVFQIHKSAENRQLYFFVNSNSAHSRELTAKFPQTGSQPWVWNPETGERWPMPGVEKNGWRSFTLAPLQSLLLVFEDPAIATTITSSGNPPANTQPLSGKPRQLLTGPWQASFQSVNGERFERNFKRLEDFGKSTDTKLNTFAGTITYRNSFRAKGTEKLLKLEASNRGITEVFVNGIQAGVNWYGPAQFSIDGLLKPGENTLEIRYTSVLLNYARSLYDNPTARRWTEDLENVSNGMTGQVQIW